MKRFVGVCFFVLWASVGFAAPVTDGYTQMWGRVRQADGTYASFSNVWVHYTVEEVQSRSLTPKATILTPPTKFRPQPRALSTVYSADSGEPYSTVDPEAGAGCSCLDDVQMLSTAVGRPWKSLTFGYDTPDGHNFYYQWFVYSTFTSGLGASVSAFSGVIFNGGGYFPVPASMQHAGTFKITVDLASSHVNITSSTSSIFFAQWFQSSQNPVTGSGPFDQSMSNVFSTNQDIATGSSANTFYFDGDLNGVYDEQEADVFADPPPPFGNLLLGITIDTSVAINEIPPTAVQLLQGKYVSGDYTDTWYEDQSYYIASPVAGKSISREVPINPIKGPRPIEIQEEIDAKAGSTVANSLDFNVIMSGSLTGGKVRVSFYNWQTAKWELRNTVNLTSTDTSFLFSSTNNPSKYVSQDANRKLRALIQLVPSSSLPPTYRFKLEYAHWTITHP